MASQSIPDKPVRGVDICALNDAKYIVQGNRGHFVKVNSLREDLSEHHIRTLHESCKNGDHYMAAITGPGRFTEPTEEDNDSADEPTFFIIKNGWCSEVSNLESSPEKMYKLHTNYQGGSFFIANRSGFYIIHSEDNTFSHTKSLEYPQYDYRESLSEDFRGGLHYFATDDFFYVVKTLAGQGLVYYRRTSLRNSPSQIRLDHFTAQISTSVTDFLQNQEVQVLSYYMVHAAPLCFSREMSMSDFLMYVKARGLIHEHDQIILQDKGISASVFIILDSTEVDKLGFSFGGRKLLKSLLEELKSDDQVDEGAMNLSSLVAPLHIEDAKKSTPRYEKVSKFSNNPNHKVKRIVCNEIFEELLKKHLHLKGIEIKEKYMDKAFELANYDCTDAEIECGTIHEFPPVLSPIDTPFEYHNKSDSPITEEYDKVVEVMEGLEYTKTNCSEWNICGGLSAVYQGVGASARIGYTKGQSEMVKKTEGRVMTLHIKKMVSVPPNRYIRVVVTQKFQRNECKVKNVKLIFPKNAKIKVKGENLYIKEVLKDYIEDAEANPLTARLEGKYVWVETSVFLDVGDPKPIAV